MCVSEAMRPWWNNNCGVQIQNRFGKSKSQENLYNARRHQISRNAGVPTTGGADEVLLEATLLRGQFVIVR